MKVGDTAGFNHSETCKICGKIYVADWKYGDNDGKSTGYAERLCCKSV